MESLRNSKFQNFNVDEKVEISTMSNIIGGALRENAKTKDVGETEWSDTAHQEITATGDIIWVLDL